MFIIDELIPLKGSYSGPDVLKGFSYSYANSYSVLRECALLSTTLKSEIIEVLEYVLC